MSKSHSEHNELSDVLDASLDEQQKQDLETYAGIHEDFKAFQKKEEETRGHLYVLGNLLLGVFTLGIVHAIFYLGCLIAYGTEFQKWESKDPITWFFTRINLNVVIKSQGDKEIEELSLEEKSSVSSSV